MVEQLGLAMMPACHARSVGIYLADHQRHIGLHPPRRRVVDHHAAALDGLRRKLARCLRAGREEGDVDALERRRRRLGDSESPICHRDAVACRPARREGADVGRRELALEQNLEHRPADEPGGADNGDDDRPGARAAHAFSSSKAACSARVAAARWSRPMTQVMRISEVVIISMLAPISPRTANIRAG